MQVTHSLTVIFFSRTHLTSPKAAQSNRESSSATKSPAVQVDNDGRLYEVRLTHRSSIIGFANESCNRISVPISFL